MSGWVDEVDTKDKKAVSHPLFFSFPHLLSLRLNQREAENKFRTLSFLAEHLNVPTMILNDHVRNGKPKPYPFVLRRVVIFKNAVYVFFHYPGTIIIY